MSLLEADEMSWVLAAGSTVKMDQGMPVFESVRIQPRLGLYVQKGQEVWIVGK